MSMNVFTQVYNTADGMIKTVAYSCRVIESSTSVYNCVPIYVNRYAPTDLEMALMAIGATAIVVVVCTALVLGFYKINDFFNDIHTMAENSKKKE